MQKFWQLLLLLLIQLLLHPLVMLLAAVAEDNSELKFYVLSKRHSNQFIGDLRDKLQQSSLISKVQAWSQVKYEILSVKPIEMRMRISDEGKIYATSPLLRERLCSTLAITDCSEESQKNICEVTVNVKLINSDNNGDYIRVNAIFSLQDTDEFAPEFRQPRIEREMLESETPGFHIDLDRAIDIDSRGFASCHLKYRLISCSSNAEINSPFHLDEYGDSKRPIGVRLQLTQSLDREKTDRVILCIAAADQRNFQKSATATIVVRIRDFNDNQPIWSPKQKFSAQVAESVRPEYLLQLNATDADEKFGIVNYKLRSPNSLFYIDSSGRLKLRANTLDFEKKKQHVLEVVAYDNGEPPRSASASIIINVADSNDNAPIIKVKQYQKIVENNQPNEFLQSVVVTDRDSGENANINCHLTRTSDPASFELRLKEKSPGSSLYDLYATAVFDREVKAHHEIIISCSDAGQPALTSTATVRMSVTDLNDNAPKFAVSPIDFSVREDKREGESLHNFRLIDPDEISDSSKRPSFNLSGFGADQFSIRHRRDDTYSFISVKSLDREVTASYNLSLVVTDYHPDGAHSASTSVLIKVIDVNDCDPEFDQRSRFATFNITENATINSIVGKLTASDKDSGYNGRVTYRMLRSSGKDSRSFRVDDKTGILRLNAQLDRDGSQGKAQYHIQVLALDSGSPRRTATASITIDLIDCNDNRPRFRSNSPIRINVSCDHTQKNHFLRVDTEAADDDASEEYRKMEFRLHVEQLQFGRGTIGGLAQHTFDIDTNTGQIFLQSVPELCQSAKYKLKLEVFEPGFHRDVSRKIIFISFEGGDRRPGQRPSHMEMEKSGSSRGIGQPERKLNSGFSLGEVVLMTVLLCALIGLILLMVFVLSVFCRSRNSGHGKGNAGQQRPAISLPVHSAMSPNAQNQNKFNATGIIMQHASIASANSRYGSLQRQRRRNASMDDDEEAVAQPMQLHGSVSQQLPQDRSHGYQKIMAGCPLSASESYMTCHYPTAAGAVSERGERSFIPTSRSYTKMIDSKQRPSEPSSLKSSYFTVSHV